MTINTIVLDLDGTLLNSQKEISVRTKETLIRAQEKGYKIVLASGRPTNGMMHVAKELEMDKHHGYIVSFNGACVIDAQSGEVMFNQTIDTKIAYDLFKHLEHFKVIPMVVDDTTMYVEDVFAGIINIDGKPFNIIEYESRGGNFKLCEVNNYAKDVRFPLKKVLIAAEAAYLQNHYQEIMEPFKDKLHCVFSAPFYFEFTHKDVDKAKTLESVLHQHGIEKKNIIAFGDGHNDISMVKYAAKGVAMENAVEDLKAIADLHTHSNDHDGIAHILETVLNI